MIRPAPNYYDIRLTNKETGETFEQYGCYGETATKARNNFVRRLRYSGALAKGDKYSVEQYEHNILKHRGWDTEPRQLYIVIDKNGK